MCQGGASRFQPDASGEFKVERLAPGSYQIMMMGTANAMMPEGMATIAVKDGEVTRHDFAKKVGGRKFAGGVSKDGKPMAGAVVMLIGGTSGMKPPTTTDENGHFSFDGLDPGDYTVMVQTSFAGGGTASRKVSVGADGKVEDVQLDLSSLRVTGDVIDSETGKAVAGAQITLEDGGTASTAEDALTRYRGRGASDGGGRFEIKDVQTGTFTLRASAPGYVATTLDGVAAGTVDLHVTLNRGVSFLVTVTGPDNTPVSGATVLADDAAGHTSSVFDMNSPGTGRDGIAHLRLAPGHYRLHVAAANYLPATVEVDTDAGSTTVRLETGATLDVEAKNADGSPAGGATVSVFDANGAKVERGMDMGSLFGAGDRTDPATGHAVRNGLPSGRVTVKIRFASGEEQSAETTLAPGAPQKLSFTAK
jgi:hypothetical protein